MLSSTIQFQHLVDAVFAELPPAKVASSMLSRPSTAARMDDCADVIPAETMLGPESGDLRYCSSLRALLEPPARPMGLLAALL